MPRTPLIRLIQRPGLLGGFLFGATMLVAAALAYQAARAAASHRAAAEATLEHHATIAAWRFARDARSWVGYGMSDAADRLSREAPRAVLAGPELISTVLAEQECDCMSAGFSRTVFRVTLDREPTLTVRGEPLSERAKDGLIDASIAVAADTTRRSGGNQQQWRILPPGAPKLTRATDVTLIWVIGDRPPAPRAAYGMIVDPAQIARPLLGALRDVQFFPPSLVPTDIADSLVRIEVAGPNHQPLFTAGPDTHAFVGIDTLGASLGGLTVTAAIHPDAAPLLLGGGLPGSRVPTIAALLALAVALGGGALMLLRREHRLARLREDFVSSVSHELRTPLTQIRLLSELLGSDGFRSAAERERATGVIHREALRLTNLVDNILEFARLRRTSGAPAATPVSLAAVATELAESLAPLLDSQGARLEVVVEEDLFVAGGRDTVSRILRNLVENAVKYGAPGQTIRLTVARGGAAGAARITVDDEGPGIPEGERTRIWQPYYRLDRDRNAAIGGSGLGLSVVAEVMRELGGSASVGDAPGKGARFVIEFPGAVDAALVTGATS